MRKLLLLAITVLVFTAAPPGVESQILDEYEIEAPASAYPEVSSGTVLLRLRFVDRSTLLPTAVRIGVFDSTGSAVSPSSPRGFLFQDIGSNSYFYCDGVVELLVPAGPVTIRAQKGFEYQPISVQKLLLRDTHITFAVRRWIDPRGNGWFSGDTHTHMAHNPIVYELAPEDLMLAMEAEDLHVLNSMDNEEQFTGGPHPLSGSQRVLYFSREYRNPVFGHLTLLGLSEWITTEEGCWDTTGVACGRILNSVVAADVHAQSGAILIATHPFPTSDYFDISPWPGGGVARGIPFDLVDRNIDAIDVLCYTHARPPEGLEEHTQALNAGFRIPASAGTDANLSRASSYPPGGYRVYAKVGQGPGDFDSKAWIDAVKSGTSFVTNFPIIDVFEIEGHEVGSTVTADEPMLTGYVSARCAVPMERVEIVTEGGIAAVLLPPPGSDAKHISGSFQLDTGLVRWVVARVTGPHNSWHVVSASGLFAQTNPIYIDHPDTSTPLVYPAQRQAADHFIARLTQLTSLFNTWGFYPPESKPAFDDALDRALVHYYGVAPDPPTDFALLEPMAWSYQHGSFVASTTTPTLRWETAADHDPGGYVDYVIMYGPDSTFSALADTVVVTDTLYTVPVQSPLSNLERYYWTVTAVDESGFRTKAIPPLSSFLVDVTASSTPNPVTSSDWRMEHAVPNPFNPTIRVGYTVPATAGAHSIEVVSVLGTVVQTLYSGIRPAGRYEVEWNGNDNRGTRVASGIYFLRLSSAARGTIFTQKILMLK